MTATYASGATPNRALRRRAALTVAVAVAVAISARAAAEPVSATSASGAAPMPAASASAAAPIPAASASATAPMPAAPGPADGAGRAAVADAGAAVDSPRPDWRVVHCGVARGVLYLTYTVAGQARVTPAFATPAVQAACAAAGHPVAGAPRRTPPALAATPRLRAAPAPVPARSRVEPTFVALALGATLAIDGRNDGDTAYRCVINYAWTDGANRAGPRASTSQVTLAAHQVDRVVTIAAPTSDASFVGAPSWFCSAID